MFDAVCLWLTTNSCLTVAVPLNAAALTKSLASEANVGRSSNERVAQALLRWLAHVVPPHMSSQQRERSRAPVLEGGLQWHQVKTMLANGNELDTVKTTYGPRHFTYTGTYAQYGVYLPKSVAVLSKTTAEVERRRDTRRARWRTTASLAHLLADQTRRPRPGQY